LTANNRQWKVGNFSEVSARSGDVEKKVESGEKLIMMTLAAFVMPQ